MIIALDDQTELEISKVENSEGELVDSYTIIQSWGMRQDVVVLDKSAATKLVHKISQDFLRKENL